MSEHHSRTSLFHKFLAERILVLDGAMGSLIQTYKLEEADYRGDRFADWSCDVKGNNDVLVLSQPKIIMDIHRAYLEAGADIIETNTFNRSEEHTSELQSRETISYAVFCLKKKKNKKTKIRRN